MIEKILLVTGFKRRISDAGSDRSIHNHGLTVESSFESGYSIKASAFVFKKYATFVRPFYSQLLGFSDVIIKSTTHRKP